MTELEKAARQALEALEMWCPMTATYLNTRDEAITALRRALEQPAQKRPPNCGTGYCSCIECLFESEQPAQQEPVADFKDWYDNAHWGNEDFKQGCHRAWNAAIKHTRPQAREWVGLTDEDVMSIAFNFDVSSLSLVAKAVEAKLREKNT